VVDFGLTSEGTANRAQTTVNARGTPGYVAPELLATKAIYTNNVDIWSIGCILYELCEGRKAFSYDGAPMHRINNVQLEIKLDEAFSQDDHESISNAFN
jgi:serine/threonine protein kinase